MRHPLAVTKPIFSKIRWSEH